MTSPFESSGNVLEDFLDALQDLPVDTQRGLELIRELARIEDHCSSIRLCPHKRRPPTAAMRDIIYFFNDVAIVSHSLENENLAHVFLAHTQDERQLALNDELERLQPVKKKKHRCLSLPQVYLCPRIYIIY